MHDQFTHEVRTAFGSGSMLQELYITPALLSADNWDQLAAAARWARRNQAILIDSHWVGGDPLKGEVYGWAACARDGAILTLRNPSGTSASFQLDAMAAFEIWDRSAWPATLQLRSPYADQRMQQLLAPLDAAVTVELAAFEVIVFELHRS